MTHCTFDRMFASDALALFIAHEKQLAFQHFFNVTRSDDAFQQYGPRLRGVEIYLRLLWHAPACRVQHLILYFFSNGTHC